MRQIVRIGKPMNPQHPPVIEEFSVLETVIGKWEEV
jgi:hypothetical protein